MDAAKKVVLFALQYKAAVIVDALEDKSMRKLKEEVQPPE